MHAGSLVLINPVKLQCMARNYTVYDVALQDMGHIVQNVLLDIHMYVINKISAKRLSRMPYG